MKPAAEFISEFFSPLLVPLLTFMLILNQSANAQMLPIEKLICFAIAAIFSSGLIYVYVHYLKHKQVIGSTALTDRNQRISPMTFAVLSYGFGFLVLWLGSRSALLRIPDLMLGLMFCYATNTMVLLLITRSWKISPHRNDCWHDGRPHPCLWTENIAFLCADPDRGSGPDDNSRQQYSAAGSSRWAIRTRDDDDSAAIFDAWQGLLGQLYNWFETTKSWNIAIGLHD